MSANAPESPKGNAVRTAGTCPVCLPFGGPGQDKGLVDRLTECGRELLEQAQPALPELSESLSHS